MTGSDPAPPADAPPAHCLAIPGAARHGWREDALCASLAKTEVDFHGRTMSVCRMHEATYRRWGADAEANAVRLWAWDPEPPVADDGTRIPRRRVGHTPRAADPCFRVMDAPVHEGDST